MLYQQCIKCGEKKSLENFHRHKITKNGYRSICKNCVKIYKKENEKHIKKYNKKYRKNNRDYFWVWNTLDKHEKRGLVINIKNDELLELLSEALENGCPYCGYKLAFGEGNVEPNSPSLDLIDPSNKVIEKSNIQILCQSCNAGKYTLTSEQFIDKCCRVAEKFKNR